jgi:hypothetical protein
MNGSRIPHPGADDKTVPVQFNATFGFPVFCIVQNQIRGRNNHLSK